LEGEPLPLRPRARVSWAIVQPPVPAESLSALARRAIDPASPPALRQLAAKGLAPGLKPGEALTVVALLSEAQDADLAAVARATLDKLPEPLVTGALAGELPAGVLALIAPAYARNAKIAYKILAHAAITAETVAVVAAGASEEVAELVATNEQRLLAHPEIIEKLYMNKSTRMSTADRILELAVRNKVELPGIPAYKEAAIAIGQELIVEAADEPTPDDLLFRETEVVAEKLAIDVAHEDTHRFDDEKGEEILEDKFLPLYAQLAKMTISQKIRRAMLGNAAERLLLVRDSNRLVAQAAIKSPSIQENEVVRISSSRTVSEDVLRAIALDREWTRSHQVKVNLVSNPRTPFAFASRLIIHLRESELKGLAKSKNVSGAVAKAAKQQLERKGAG
jgi:hypothetical protein